MIDLQVPSDFILKEEARYAISFGNHLVTSDQFDRSSKSKNGLEFSISSGDSNLQMHLAPGQKRLKMTLDLSDVHLYNVIARYLLHSRDETSSKSSTIYMPIRVSAHDFQTGEVRMSFTFKGENGVGKGSAIQLVPIR